jgi:hypothetical protein
LNNLGHSCVPFQFHLISRFFHVFLLYYLILLLILRISLEATMECLLFTINKGLA